MGALIRSLLAGSPETRAFISFLHMPKPPCSGGTRLEPALGWFPLLLLKAQLKPSKAESNSQQVNIHLQQREDGSGRHRTGCTLGAVPAHTQTPTMPQVTLSQSEACAAKVQQTSCQCCRASTGISLSPQVSLNRDPSLARARSSQKPPWCCLGTCGCCRLSCAPHCRAWTMLLSSGGKASQCPGKGEYVPGLPGAGDPCLFPPCPKDIIWIPASEQLP